jgi:hypothetical protein
MKRWKKALAFAGLGALGVAACEGWEVWDEVFNRKTHGWMTGDGGSTVLLPGVSGTKRLLWVFGDTLGHPMVETHFLQWVPKFVFGNTLAIHPINNKPSSDPPAPLNNSNPGSPTATEFYGRDSQGNAAEITWEHTSGVKQYFRNKTCSGAGVVLVWPGDGLVVNGNELVFFTWWIQDETHEGSGLVLPYPRQNVIQKMTGVTTTSTPFQWACSTTGVWQPPEQYSTFPPSDETFEADPPALWGVAVYRHTNGFIYIFGARQQPGAGDAALVDAIVAKTVDADIFEPRKWQYAYKAGASIKGPWGVTGGCSTSSWCWLGGGVSSPVGQPIQNGYPHLRSRRDDLHPAALDVGPEFSVERITHTEEGPHGNISASRFIMVHGALNPLLDADGNDVTQAHLAANPHLNGEVWSNLREVVVRSSNYLVTWPGPDNGDVYPSTGSLVGSTARHDIIAKGINWPSIGNVGAADPNVVTGYNAYRNVHAVKGHADISPPGSIHVTYAVWSHWLCGDGVCESAWDDTTPVLAYSSMHSYLGAWVSPFRSMRVPLRVVYPWCRAHFSGSVCQYP